MAYIKQTWIDNESPLTAERMNHIEDGISSVEYQVSQVQGGTPKAVTQASEMTDTSLIYLYMGDETGYESGHFYYFDGTQWQDGGQYGSSSGGVNIAQWNDIISLFRAAIYDTSILADPESVIDDLENSIRSIPATNITLSVDTLSFTNGSAKTIAVTLAPPNTTDIITAESGNTSVATATVNNRVVSVSPVANGSTIITITTSSGLVATASVSVALPQLFTITNTLTGCTTNNDADSIYENEGYSAILTLDTDYTFSSVSITMGNVDVTSTAWNSSTNTITIASVTGNLVITAIATSPVLYSLANPYIASGSAENYINTRLYLGESNDISFSIAGYILFNAAFPNMGGTNMRMLYLGKPTDTSQFGLDLYNSLYSLNGMNLQGTPANYNHKQNVKLVITHQAGTLSVNIKLKYFDQENTSAENRTATGTKSFDSFVACENPLYIGKRTDGYGVCNNLTIQTLKIFNYVMNTTDIDTYIATEEATV